MWIGRRGKANTIMTKTNGILICVFGDMFDFVSHTLDFKLESVLVALRLVCGVAEIGCGKRNG